MENTHTNLHHGAHHNRNDFFIGEIVWSGWEQFKKYWKELVALLFGYMLASIPFAIVDGIWQTRLYSNETIWNEFLQEEILQSVWVAGTSETVLYIIFFILMSLWSLIVGFNFYKSYFSIYDGHKYSLASIFKIPTDSELTRFMRYVGVGILYFLIVFAGLILLIIPGIYFSIRFGQVFNLVLDKNFEVIEAFKMSSKMTEGIKWKMFRYDIVLGLLCVGVFIVGLLALLVGVVPAIFIAFNWVLISNITLYRRLYEVNK